MKYLFFMISLLFILGTSCSTDSNSSENGDSNEVEMSSADDDLQAPEKKYKEVLALHDEIMPKMAEVNRIGREIKALETVPEEGKADIEAAISLLNQAESRMDSWMQRLGAYSDMNKLRAEMEEAQLLTRLEMEMTRGESLDKFVDSVITMGNNQIKRFKKES